MRLFLLLCLLPFVAIGSDGAGSQCQTPSDIIVKSSNYDVICHDDWVSLMDPSAKIPFMVYYTIYKSKTDLPPMKRKDYFAVDPTYPLQKQASPKDYHNSGYDKGHMYSNSDADYSQDTVIRCFYMTNMTPQTHSLNAGPWLEYENKTRQYSTMEGDIRVYAISVYDYSGKSLTYMSGTDVVIPNAFIKIIVHTNGSHEAYYFKNDESKSFNKISDEDIKSYTGIIFKK